MDRKNFEGVANVIIDINTINTNYDLDYGDLIRSEVFFNISQFPKASIKTKDFLINKDIIKNTYTQEIKQINARQIEKIKFGCGMHTLYSKSFWELVTIPESFGGYGPEDTYGMAASELAIKLGYDIKQIVLDGVYITEDYIDRTPSFIDKIKPIDKKKEFYEKAHSIGQQEVSSFAKNLIRKNTPNL